MTHLRRWSEGVLEASWLLAAGITPVFFNAHAANHFELSKVILVRILALLMAAAWIVRRFESDPADVGPARDWWRAPVTIPLLAYVAAMAFSTLISLAPAASFWGVSSVRLDGLVTLAAYLVVFVTIAARLRRPEAMERLLDAIVVASLLICLYSLMQAAGLDPIDWRGLFEEGRFATTIGNPTFAGSYLVVVMPLTLAHGLSAWRAGAGRLRALFCGAAFVLQCAALVLTRSRGPWISAVAGLFVFGVLAGAVRRRRLWTALAFAPAVAFSLFVLVLNVPRGPLEPLRGKPSLHRLAHLFDKATPDLSGRSRYLIWKGAFDLARPRPALADSEGRPDRFRRLRPFFGYGMETLALGFHAVYEAEFARIERRRHFQGEEPMERPSQPLPIPDRSHNEFWDSVVFGGWLGGAAHLALYASLLALALRVLGLGMGRSRWRFAGYLGIAGLLAGAGVSDALGWPYLGVAVPLGLAAAFTIHALLATFRGEVPREGPTPWLAIGIAAALLGHFVEVHLGLSVPPARLYFWILAGLLVAAFHEPSLLVPAVEPPREPKESRTAKPRSRRSFGAFLRQELPGSAPAGLLAAAFMVTLLLDFVKPSSLGLLGTLVALLGGKRGQGQLLVLGMGLLAVGLVIALDQGRARRGRASLAWGLALVVAFAFGAIHLETVTRVRDVHSDLRALEDFSRWVFAQYALVLVALALGLGAALSGPWEGARFARRGRASVAVGVAALLAAAVLARSVGLRKAEAESLVQIGSVFERSSRYPVATAVYERASQIDPREPRYALFAGKASLLASRRPLPAPEIQSWIDISEQAFERARALSPYEPGHLANLARLKIRRSEVADPGQAEIYKDQAEDLYVRALRLSPNNEVLLDELGIFQLIRRGKLDDAERNLKRSLDLDPSYYLTYTALGELYVARGQAARDKRKHYYRSAIAYYEHSMKLQFSARTAVALGLLSLEVEDKPTSVRRLEDALRYEPTPDAARKVHAQLARLYQELGQPEKAAPHAALVAPPAAPPAPPRRP